MEGSGTGHSPLVDGPATRGQRSQPVVGRVHILCKELMQEPQGRLRLPRAYKKKVRFHLVCLFVITHMCVWQGLGLGLLALGLLIWQQGCEVETVQPLFVAKWA